MNSTVTYKCPNCDAGLIFDAEKQSFKCEFCLSSFTEEALDATASAKRAEEAKRENEQFSAEIKEYHCASCGAEVITDTLTVADYCYYCHNPIVLASGVSGAMKPTKIIPFKLDRDGAKNAFLAYAKKKKFVPKNYFEDAQVDKIQGVYYPFWVTDADTFGEYGGIGKRVRSWTSGGYRYTETSSYAVKREGEIHFEDITTSAISKADKAMLEGVLPYPLDAYIDFNMPYLQGFVAKKRDIDRKDLTGEVRGKMNSYAHTLLSGTVHGYSSFTGDIKELMIYKSHWEYALLPIWILTYVKEKKGGAKKIYTYAMNGDTGKIYGELPVSIPKLILLLLGTALGAFLISLLIIFGGGLWI